MTFWVILHPWAHFYFIRFTDWRVPTEHFIFMNTSWLKHSLWVLELNQSQYILHLHDLVHYVSIVAVTHTVCNLVLVSLVTTNLTVSDKGPHDRLKPQWCFNPILWMLLVGTTHHKPLPKIMCFVFHDRNTDLWWKTCTWMFILSSESLKHVKTPTSLKGTSIC